MEDKIKEAKDLLMKNGYIVIKLSKGQEKDSEACGASGFESDCTACSCSVCIVQ